MFVCEPEKFNKRGPDKQRGLDNHGYLALVCFLLHNSRVTSVTSTES